MRTDEYRRAVIAELKRHVDNWTDVGLQALRGGDNEESEKSRRASLAIQDALRCVEKLSPSPQPATATRAKEPCADKRCRECWPEQPATAGDVERRIGNAAIWLQDLLDNADRLSRAHIKLSRIDAIEIRDALRAAAKVGGGNG